jgi:hypothetical protein
LMKNYDIFTSMETKIEYTDISNVKLLVSFLRDDFCN